MTDQYEQTNTPQRSIGGQDQAALRDFLSRVVPSTTDGGFISIHWQIPGEKGFLGKSCCTVEDAIKQIAKLQGRKANIYFCLSRQRFGKGKRSRADALDLQVTCFDIDLAANDPNKYARPAEAIAAVLRFCLQLGIPKPSFIVLSGGGLHVYWISDRALTVEEWQPFADALKNAARIAGLLIDGAVTGDAARVLRVPGTLNYKYDPPRPVRVLPNHSTGEQHDFSKVFAPLMELAPAGKEAGKQPNLAHLGPLAEAFKHLELPSLDAGNDPLPFAPIKAECAWLREAHDHGGKDYDQPQWNLTTLCATFLEDGNALAHAFGNQHPEYSPESTEALWARKIRERKESDIGWPRCKTVRDAGSKHFALCPHFTEHVAAGKSPLHLGLDVSDCADDDIEDGTKDGMGDDTRPRAEYDPVDRDAPELGKLDAAWVARIFEGDTEGTYQNDETQLAFAIACELVRIKVDNDFIARVLMTTKCGIHVQERPAYRLLRTIRRAHEFAIDPDLEKMNSQHAVLPIGDKTRVVTWGDDPDFPGRKTIVRAQTFDDFKNLHSNKRKRVKTKNKDGKPTTEYPPLGHWWLTRRHRRQYDGGQRFMPQHEAEVVGNVLNMFEGFPIQPRKPAGRSGASGCQLLLDHGHKIMCSGDEEHWDYLEKREAWIARNRRRSEIACAYRTEEEGSGKGFWCNQLGRLYGPYYMKVIKPEHVIGKHNPHLETLLKLGADEALFVGDPRHRNTLFGLITEPTVDIEPKFVNVYPAPNHLNIDILSNAKHFVPVGPTARRFFIPTVSENRVGDLEYFAAIDKQLKDGGYEALLYHLLYEVDLRDFEVRRVPRTAGLLEQAGYSRKGVDGLVEKICSDGYVPCAHPDWPDYSVSSGFEKREGFDYFIDHHVDRDLRYLANLKVKNQLRNDWRCMTGKDARRRHANELVNGVRWPPLQELRELFVKRHGPQDWLNPDGRRMDQRPGTRSLHEITAPAWRPSIGPDGGRGRGLAG